MAIQKFSILLNSILGKTSRCKGGEYSKDDIADMEGGGVGVTQKMTFADMGGGKVKYCLCNI